MHLQGIGGQGHLLKKCFLFFSLEVGSGCEPFDGDEHAKIF